MSMYDLTQQQVADIDNRFTYHAPVPEMNQTERYVAIRDKARDFAQFIAHACPQSRELSVALTHIDEAVMNANAAIARNEKAPAVEEPSGE